MATAPLAGARFTVAVPNRVLSATLVAVTVTVCALDIVDGAVYSPFTIVPVCGFIDHVTAVLLVPVTAAVNCCDWEACRLTADGLTLTAIPPPPELEAAVPLISTRRPVGFVHPPHGALLTTKSSVFTPALNPLLIVNAVNPLNTGLAGPTVTPFSWMLAPLSLANCPVSNAVPGFSPVRSNVVR